MVIFGNTGEYSRSRLNMATNGKELNTNCLELYNIEKYNIRSEML